MIDLGGTDWPYGANDAIGQTGEFLVWAALTSQSAGRLHVFLPLLDRGIDALIHRVDDGAYIAVQVKSKTAIGHGEAPIAVYEDHLFTPDQIVIGVFLNGGALGQYAFVADAATLTTKATRIDDRGRTMLIIDIPIEPTASHKWSEHLVPATRIAERLGLVPKAPSTVQPPSLAPAPPDFDRVVGFIGEQEVCRRLATLEACDLFRPFPDNEIVEVIVRRLASGATLGLQVKTAELDQPHAMRHVVINRATFVAAPTTYVVCLGWIAGDDRFHDNCLLIPSSDVPSIASSNESYFELHFRPDGSSEPSRLDRYRMPLAQLTDAVSGLLAERIRPG